MDDTQALPAPTITVPPRFTTNVRPTLQWSAVAGAASYEVWIAKVSPIEDRQFRNEPTVTTTSWTPPADLDPAVHRVWIRAIDGTGAAGEWSAQVTFEVQGGINGPNAEGFVKRPEFSWQAVPGATSYEVFIRTSVDTFGTNGDLRVAGLPAGQTTFTPTVDLPIGPIRWWVRAGNSVGNRGWSVEGSFNVDGRTTIQPVQNNTISWQAIAGASRYVLFVQRGNDPVAVLRQESLDVTQFNVSSLGAGNYRAWVKAIDGRTNAFVDGFWSLPADFSITQQTESSADSLLRPILTANVSPELAQDDLQFRETEASEVDYAEYLPESEEVAEPASDTEDAYAIDEVMGRLAGVDSSEWEASHGYQPVM